MIDPQALLDGAGPWAVALVCLIAFVETGLLIGFFLPGDTLLFFVGVFVATGVIGLPVPVVILLVAASAFLGDQLGFVIGRSTGPRIFERKDSGIFSRASVARTQGFFDRFGGWAVTIARFVPVVRTFAPVAAGVGKMRYAHFVGFNALGAAVWSTAIILLGFFLGRIPGVADFVGKYIDVVLIGIVVISVGGIALTYWRQRRRAARDA
ncbi:DedA family protein [Clavibacter phaseoli]|uniref:DedA family protein n=2 Tax=Clavibacter phaseoli TaxID=1734031 RepID=UPI000E66A313|nr:VTT domain-containing protein [Clavibacter phaseoli]MBM7389863.1 membrane-associated protein [Clavibacter michiganensis]RIJ55766.1 DedA family protein [Clavibacter phaseoli]UKF31935.1 DedA family protein [Clavibacter phaseoli]UKF37857.1 DedA family protein [Clavibacter phaseoli]